MEFTWLSRWQPQLLAVLRIITALLFLEHGMMKLFHFPAPQMPGPVMGDIRTNDGPSLTRPDLRQATSASCRHASRSATHILPQAANPRTTREPTRYRATPRAMRGECEGFL